MRQRGDVDLNHLQLPRKLRLRELSTQTEAGVVDQDFDRDVLVLQEIVDRFRRLAAPQIRGEDVRLDVELSLELPCSRLERVSLARDEDEIKAIAGEDFCELEPDAAGATSDEGGGSLNSI